MAPKSDKEKDFESRKVTVAVRVRPMNRREVHLGSSRCLSVYGGANDNKHTSVAIAQPAGSPNQFTFDHAYPASVSQTQVFEDIGEPALRTALQGYNACIFAYGQTGSGKSYAMMGPSDAAHALALDEAPALDGTDSDTDGPAMSATQLSELSGLTPRIASSLFQQIEQFKAESRVKHTGEGPQPATSDFKVTVTYVEIYQEKLRCLLGTQRTPLKLRQHATQGAVIEGVHRETCDSALHIATLLDKGNSARVVKATNMNDQSSRSHAIFSIRIVQTRTIDADSDEPTVTERTSQMNLVDLAGSERAKSTGAEGDALREGANINLSLTVLGKVISALAESSKGKKAPLVPYRESTLTWLLKEDLGGNSVTFMLSTLSPAAVNYDETLSTLRYADRAKSIVTHACVNEDTKDRKIRELNEEVEQLRAKLAVQASQSASQPVKPLKNGPSLLNVAGGGDWLVEPVDEIVVLGGVCNRIDGEEPMENAASDEVAHLLETQSKRHLQLDGSAESGVWNPHLVIVPETRGDVTVYVLHPVGALHGCDTHVNGEQDPLEDPFDLEPGTLIHIGEDVVLKFNDPRGTTKPPARSRRPLTARKVADSPEPAAPTAQVPPLPMSSPSPSVPPIALPGVQRPFTEQAPACPPLQTSRTPRTAVALGTPRLGGSAAQSTTDELVSKYAHTFVFLGDSGVGKTALRTVLGRDLGFFESFGSKKAPETTPTVGAELARFPSCGGATKADVTVLDVSGDDAFLSLLSLVPETRCTFALFFKLGESDLKALKLWIEQVQLLAPSQKTNVILVGTHLDASNGPSSGEEVCDVLSAVHDDVMNLWRALESRDERRPRIVARFAVSSRDRTVVAGQSSDSGIPLTSRTFRSPVALAVKNVKNMTSLLEWMAQHSVEASRNDDVFPQALVPSRALALAAAVAHRRARGRFAISAAEYKSLAKETDSRYSDQAVEDLHKHTQLLHSWFLLIHQFRHTTLKRTVIVDPSWALSVLATLLSAVSWSRNGGLASSNGALFNCRDVLRIDSTQGKYTLSAGILSRGVASELFRTPLRQRNLTARDVCVVFEQLENFDMIVPLTRMLGVQEGKLVSIQGQVEGNDVNFAVPSLFHKTAPPEVTTFLVGLLNTSGPCVRFSLSIVPPSFFSRLLCRLSRHASGVYVGSTAGRLRPWSDCAWIVAGDRSRLFIRMVSRSLFVTFHDHEEDDGTEESWLCADEAKAEMLAEMGTSLDDTESAVGQELRRRSDASKLRRSTLQRGVRQTIREVINETAGAVLLESERWSHGWVDVCSSAAVERLSITCEASPWIGRYSPVGVPDEDALDALEISSYYSVNEDLFLERVAGQALLGNEQRAKIQQAVAKVASARNALQSLDLESMEGESPASHFNQRDSILATEVRALDELVESLSAST